MRVRTLRAITPYFNYGVVSLAEGQEVVGDLAAYLASTRSEVEPLDDDAQALFGGATGNDSPEPSAELDIDATAVDILAWVGDDPERAAEVLEVEQAKGKPRSTLVKQLEKLVSSSGE